MWFRMFSGSRRGEAVEDHVSPVGTEWTYPAFRAIEAIQSSSSPTLSERILLLEPSNTGLEPISNIAPLNFASDGSNNRRTSRSG